MDLSVDRILVKEDNDTIVQARSLKLDVQFLPLLQGRADIDGVTLRKVRLNTRSFISDTQVYGTAGLLAASAHGVDWKKELIHLNSVRLEDADLYVALSDTAQPDTSSAPVNWDIALEQADILRSKIHLSMPGDSMRLYSHIKELALQKGRFNLGKSYYGFKKLDIKHSAVHYDLPKEPEVPGLDVSHLAFDGITLAMDTLSYNAKGELQAGLRKAMLKEKCGLNVQSLTGRIYLNNDRIYLPDLKIETPHSHAEAHVNFDFRSLEAQKGGICQALLDAELGSEDIRLLAAA